MDDEEYEMEDYLDFELLRERQEIYWQFGLLCIELKHLYVCITRPKQRLLIYDEDSWNRTDITKFWTTLNLVEVVSKGQEKEHPILKEGFETLQDAQSSIEEWRIMGIKLLRKKFYPAAISCFEKSGDDDLVKRCYAYMHADKATGLISEAEALIYSA